tara:strand:+ start:3028 stop:3234 length:207 start_codon:yes stop_codon:yes gene_type:complete
MDNDPNESVESILINICKRTIILFSDLGDQKVVECDNIDQFMSVMEVIKDTADPEIITYIDPVTNKAK